MHVSTSIIPEYCTEHFRAYMDLGNQTDIPLFYAVVGAIIIINPDSTDTLQTL